MTLSSRRAIQQHVPEQFWGVLLEYRVDLRASLGGDALLWLVSPVGRRMSELLRWIGTVRVNRAARRDPDRVRVYRQLYDTVRSMYLQFTDDDAFDRRRLEAVALIERLHLLYVAPLARAAELERDREARGSEAREEGYRRALQQSAALIREVIAEHSRFLRSVQIKQVLDSERLRHLKAALSRPKLIEIFGADLNPPRSGRAAKGRGKRKGRAPG